MARYLMLALNGPTKGEGDAETFNQWYDDVHVPEFQALDFIKTARRYRVMRGKMPGMENWPYLTVYEIETDDLDADSRRLMTEVGPLHPTFDKSISANLWAIQISGDD